MNLKPLLSAMLATALVAVQGSALAQGPAPQPHGQSSAPATKTPPPAMQEPGTQGKQDAPRRFTKGKMLPKADRGRHIVTDYKRYHLKKPKTGYRWIRENAGSGNFALVRISNGKVVAVVVAH